MATILVVPGGFEAGAGLLESVVGLRSASARADSAFFGTAIGDAELDSSPLSSPSSAPETRTTSTASQESFLITVERRFFQVESAQHGAEHLVGAPVLAHDQAVPQDVGSHLLHVADRDLVAPGQPRVRA